MADARDVDPTEVEALAAGRGELKAAATRQLKRIFTDRSMEVDKIKFRRLAQFLMARNEGTWPEHPNEALQEMFRAAIGEISDTEKPQDCSISWRDFGLLLYGFADPTATKANGNPHDYDSRFDYAYRVAFGRRIAKSDVSDRVTGLRRQLSMVLLKQLYPGTSTETHTDPTRDTRQPSGDLTSEESAIAQPCLDPLYTPRPKLEAQFKELHDAGANLIAFIGQAGMGKSWLARAICHQVQGAPALEIGVSGGKLNHQELSIALFRQGIKVRGSTEGREIEHLDKLVAHPTKAPSVLLLDGLETTDELRALNLHMARSCIVATCRYIGKLPLNDWRCIQVGKMNQIEAQDMTVKRLAASQADEAPHIASELQGHALLTDYVCATAQRLQIRTTAVCAKIREIPDWALQAVTTEDGRTLSEVFGEMLEQVRVRNMLAYELLAFMLIANTGGQVSSAVLVPYARSIEKRGESPELTMLVDGHGPVFVDSRMSHVGIPASVSYREAVHTLADFCIIDRRFENPTLRLLVEETYSIHPSLHGLLRPLLEHKRSEVRANTLSLFVDTRRAVYDAMRIESGGLKLSVIDLSRYVLALLLQYGFKFMAETIVDGLQLDLDLALVEFPTLEDILAVMLVRGIGEVRRMQDYGDHYKRITDDVPHNWITWAYGHLADRREVFESEGGWGLQFAEDRGVKFESVQTLPHDWVPLLLRGINATGRSILTKLHQQRIDPGSPDQI